MPRATFVSASPVVASRASTLVLATPTAIQAGDVLLAFAWVGESFDSTLVTTSLPAGWVLLSRIDAPSHGQSSILMRRIASAAEPATHTFTETATGSGYAVFGVILAYRGMDPAAAVVGAGHNRVPDASPTATFICPSLSLGAYSDLYLGFVADHNDTGTAAPPGAATMLTEQRVPGFGHLMAFDEHPLVAGASGTQTVTMSAATSGIAAAYVLRAATMPTPSIDRTANAIARLPHMYRSADPTRPTNTEKMIRALMAPADELQTALEQLLFQRSIDTAVGAQLDVIGRRVGRPRAGVTDDEIYRRYVRAQITANKSNGGMEDIYTIARLVVNDPAAVFVFRNEGAAAFVLAVSGIALADAVAAVLIALMIKATGGGVRPILEYSSATPSTVFRFDVGPGFDVGHLATGLEHV